ncbi:MAG: NADH-quinone oxidoreductase subunit A [Methanohalophilus sp. T328-1]|jgi:NADH-quinone oxidoreductase subunit A|uniref:F420H2 dehydrogenase subunit A n=1 Tax=Methanohalophilus euhalobius TaxID=51203 RepID=A0A285G0I6_9EURY|nr:MULTISPECIES: F420H2 dehydrogenase subunit FpoA [Methanohalophilus]KXS46230.1 MAG: NADH-quinone oxidoreductase subunit A [Methanohalophilus sp. T328-1]RSD33630.1 MAG: NADH-quinone oxidoreductase subunit A [Methanohalophilus sp.]OBZ35542.1 MAG: NAD(P)H-quinone oxidoreductase subunit 3 [Methanohalophilus sp. DAL1]ODV49140.1 MAG: NADH-quinone oxidoreductase subunit A [Methanohalophilus sp. 2-GBenrich]RSD33872.1 MAG: NADH-quinone oxidoreductase subunit A [Methanohalophilus sp.]
MSGIVDSNIVYSYIPVAVFLVVSLLMPPMTMLIAKLLSPRSTGAERYSTYESGSIPTGPARIQFSVEYYLYAIAFVLFDIEVLFLYPWAMIYRGNTGVDTTVAVVEMLIFIFVLLFGYAFLWKKGALRWLKN